MYNSKPNGYGSEPCGTAETPNSDLNGYKAKVSSSKGFKDKLSDSKYKAHLSKHKHKHHTTKHHKTGKKSFKIENLK